MRVMRGGGGGVRVLWNGERGVLKLWGEGSEGAVWGVGVRELWGSGSEGAVGERE